MEQKDYLAGGNIQYPVANLLDEIASDSNLYASFDYVISHLEVDEQREKYKPKREKYVRMLKVELLDGTFEVRRFRSMDVRDGPKVRRVQAPDVYSRIGCHAVMVVVEAYVYPSLIATTASSIKGRGMHWLHNRLHEDLQEDPTLYYYQSDIHHYYDSISQAIMKRQLRMYVSDGKVLAIMDRFIGLLPSGLSKGLRSSQCLANLHLSEIDHIIEKRVGYYIDGNGARRSRYYRYCDDIVIRSNSKRELWEVRKLLHSLLGELGLEIKPSEAVRPTDVGIDFLGYVDYGTHSLVRRRTKQKVARHLAKVKSRRRRRELIGSFKGMAKHADCCHLYYTLTRQRMRAFSELGVEYRPKDGKKRFPGKVTRLATIQNQKLVILDFEKDVKTDNGLRDLVSFKFQDTDMMGKFFTNSEEMKDLHRQIEQMEDGFPFRTVIRSEVVGNGVIRYFYT